MTISALLFALAFVPNSPSAVFRSPIDSTSHIAQVMPLAEESGFRFELAGCGSSANSSKPYTCNFLIENTHSSEKKLALYARSSGPWISKIVDNQGHEINAVSVSIGSNTSDRAAETTLIPGAPIRASVSFATIPDRGLRLIDLDCFQYGPGGHSFSVQFTQ